MRSETKLVQTASRSTLAGLWRSAVVQQPIPLASAGQGAYAGCFDQLDSDLTAVLLRNSDNGLAAQRRAPATA